MGKDLKGKELGTGLRQRKDGRYEARAKINGIDINLYDVDLKKLKILFEKAKEEARNNIDMKRQKITLNEWFEEWFANYKIPNIKETSVFPMRSKYYNTFGKAIGNMKVTDIRNLDIQRVINDMNKQGRASSSMRDALGRVRECLESAKNNRIIDINPCFEINVPWENKTAERRFLSMAEQTRFLQEVEHNWYKEMFYIMFLTGMRIGEVGGLKWEDIDWNKKSLISGSASAMEWKWWKSRAVNFDTFSALMSGRNRRNSVISKRKTEQAEKSLWKSLAFKWRI